MQGAGITLYAGSTRMLETSTAEYLHICRRHPRFPRSLRWQDPLPKIASVTPLPQKLIDSTASERGYELSSIRKAAMDIIGTCIGCLPASASLLLNVGVAAALLGFGIYRAPSAPTTKALFMLVAVTSTEVALIGRARLLRTPTDI